METVILLLKNLLLVSKHPLTKHFLFLDITGMSKTYVNPSCTQHYCCIPGHKIRRDQSGGTEVGNNQINFLMQSERRQVLGLKGFFLLIAPMPSRQCGQVWFPGVWLTEALDHLG